MLERNVLHYENRLSRLMQKPVENYRLIQKVKRKLRNLEK